MLALAAALVIAVAGAIVHGELQQPSKTAASKQSILEMTGQDMFTHVKKGSGAAGSKPPVHSPVQADTNAADQYSEALPPPAPTNKSVKRLSALSSSSASAQ